MTTTFNSNGNTFNNNNFDYEFDLSNYFITKDKKKDCINDILSKIQNIFPWAKHNTQEKVITITADPGTYYSILDITPQALNLEWNKAVSRLYDYIYYTNNPSYDFKISNIPVKIHGNYVQVGSKIVPKFTNSNFFDSFSKKERILMYNISMSINAISIAA